MKVFRSIEELAATEEGTHLGESGWMTLDQAAIDTFAEATGDHQWIHVDRDRAAQGPFGTTIAHGYLTLSLVPRLLSEVYRVEGIRMAVNYGLDRVRFLAPVPSGSRIRVSSRLSRSEPAGEAALRVHFASTVELEGSERPACVADSIAQFYA